MSIIINFNWQLSLHDHVSISWHEHVSMRTAAKHRMSTKHREALSFLSIARYRCWYFYCDCKVIISHITNGKWERGRERWQDSSSQLRCAFFIFMRYSPFSYWAATFRFIYDAPMNPWTAPWRFMGRVLLSNERAKAAAAAEWSEAWIARAADSVSQFAIKFSCFWSRSST